MLIMILTLGLLLSHDILGSLLCSYDYTSSISKAERLSPKSIKTLTLHIDSLYLSNQNG